jgi:hypothetical protein
MIPNITRGGSSSRLIRYLIGSGRRNEHVRPHLVAASPELLLQVGERQLALTDARGIGEFLDEPMRAFNVQVTRPVKDQDGHATGERKAAHVWHASLSLSPADPALGDATWRKIAEQFVNRLGFIGSSDRGHVRWAAIHHGPSSNGNDHIHIVVNLVREDGTIAGVHKDFSRAQAATRQLDHDHGLTGPEGPARGAGERGIKRGELESDLRRGLDVGVDGQRPENGTRRRLETLVRACAAAAGGEREFVAGLRREGVLVSPARHDKVHPDRITGFRVALRDNDGKPGPWYGGGRLSRELTLPRLRQSWAAVNEAEIARAWQTSTDRHDADRATRLATPLELRQLADELEDLRGRLQQVPPEESGTWAQVARETAGALAALSLRVEHQPGQLSRASRNLARTAQIRTRGSRSRRWRTLPPAQRLARIVLSVNSTSRSTSVMLIRILDLVDAVREMHDSAGHSRRVSELHEISRPAQGRDLDPEKARPAAGHHQRLRRSEQQKGQSMSDRRDGPGL